jgi:hypothetical protein
MIDKAKAALATYEGELTAVGYVLVLFHEDGTFTLDAEAPEDDECALEAIADIAFALDCDAQEVEVQ